MQQHCRYTRGIFSIFSTINLTVMLFSLPPHCKTRENPVRCRKFFWPRVTTKSCSAQKLDAVFLGVAAASCPFAQFNRFDDVPNDIIYLKSFFSCSCRSFRTITVWLSSPTHRMREKMHANWTAEMRKICKIKMCIYFCQIYTGIT